MDKIYLVYYIDADIREMDVGIKPTLVVCWCSENKEEATKMLEYGWRFNTSLEIMEIPKDAV